MIMTITLDESDARLIKKALNLLDYDFENIEIIDNKNLEKERHRIENIILELNTKFNLI